MMDRIVVSACLLGDRVRYDGEDNSIVHRLLDQWRSEGRLVSVCPEVSGGLTVPRPPAEIQQGDGRAVLQGEAKIATSGGTDVTEAFLKGAYYALELAQQAKCRFALLAARSPSCGNHQVYDGTFSGQLIDGSGVTAALLQANGVRVFNPTEIEVLARQLDTSD